MKQNPLGCKNTTFAQQKNKLNNNMLLFIAIGYD